MEGVGQWWSHCASKRLYKVSLERCPFGTGKFLVYAVDQTYYAIDLHLWKGVFEIRCFVSYTHYLTFSVSLLRLFFFLPVRLF